MDIMDSAIRIEAPIDKFIQPRRYPAIDSGPSNLSVAKLESDLQSERDCHY
jgi:hypothetical protein